MHVVYRRIPPTNDQRRIISTQIMEYTVLNTYTPFHWYYKQGYRIRVDCNSLVINNMLITAIFAEFFFICDGVLYDQLQ
jgi:hypothetical protein